MNSQFEKTKLKTLTWCIEDWIDLHAISWFVEEFYRCKNFELFKNITLDVIKNLLEKKLVIAGDLLEDDSFISWNMSIDKITEKIKQEWENLNRELTPNELVWFEITEKGRKEFKHLNSLPELKETDPFYFDDKK
jgi:hypothetical protein